MMLLLGDQFSLFLQHEAASGLDMAGHETLDSRLWVFILQRCLWLRGFLAAGTQMRLELPGKGGVTMPVDSIEKPVVLLKDNSVVRVSLENYATLKVKFKKSSS